MANLEFSPTGNGRKGNLSGLSGDDIHKFGAELPHVQNGCIVFIPSKGLVGVGLSRKAKPADLKEGIHYSIESPERQAYDIALGWQEIKEMQEGVVRKVYDDDNLLDVTLENCRRVQMPCSAARMGRNTSGGFRGGTINERPYKQLITRGSQVIHGFE